MKRWSRYGASVLPIAILVGFQSPTGPAPAGPDSPGSSLSTAPGPAAPDPGTGSPLTGQKMPVDSPAASQESVEKERLDGAGQRPKPYRESLDKGLAELKRLAKEETIAAATSHANRLLAPKSGTWLIQWMERQGARLGPRGVRFGAQAMRFVGLTKRTPLERAVIHYDLALWQWQAGEQEEARGSFEAASFLASGEVRQHATYNLGCMALLSGEILFDQIPEVHGRTRSAMSPGFVPGQAKGPEEEPDYLVMARVKFEEALEHFIARLRLDWRDADTRANVEWVQRRLDELRKIEEERKSDEGQGMAQDDPEAGEGEVEESKDDAGEQGANSNEPPEEEPEETEQQDRESESGEESEREDREDNESKGDQRDKEGESDNQAQDEVDERLLTEEEMKRLLKRLEQHDKEGERLRQMMKKRRSGRVKKDW